MSYLLFIDLIKKKILKIVLFFNFSVFNFLLKKYFKIEIYNFISLDNLDNKLLKNVEIINRHKEKYFYTLPSFWNYNKIEIPSTINKKVKELKLYSAQIFGNSNLILLDKNVIYQQKFDFKDYNYIFLDGGFLVYNSKRCIVKPHKNIKKINQGINLTANFSWNYFHLIYEVISKFYYINNSDLYDNIPILIDKIILQVPQYKQILDLINSKNLPIVTIEKEQRIEVKELYELPNTFLSPPGYKNIKKMLGSDTCFNRATVNFLRTELLKFKTNTVFPKRIFLSRKNASSRRSYNEMEVSNCLVKYGFTKVYTEELSISDQMTLFNEAEYIAGTTGAAFSNILFCKPNCKIICFTNYKLPLTIFSSIADFVGAEMIYFYDENKKLHSSSDLHDNFNVQTEKIDTYFTA